MKNKISLINIVTSVFLQIITIISGLIIPRIILNSFGSDINGLISSIQQFLSYITIIEGGLSGVVIANLYKPILEKDNKKISNIVKTADSFYKKIGFIFLAYSIILGIIYTFLFKTNYSFNYIFLLTIILSINMFVQYMFSLTYRCLLIADKKIYIVSIVQSIIIIINTIITIIMANNLNNIHLLKLFSGLVYLLQPLIFSYYINKKYLIAKDGKKDNNFIKERWNAFAINIAAFIHNSTDISILTIFTNLRYVSIYSIYALVPIAIKQIVSSISSAITPVIGHAYVRNNYDELYFKLDIYEYITNFLVFFFGSMAILLITPFVLLYTKGINDANYNQLVFGYLITISEMIYLLKLPHLNLAYSANKFKEITIPAFIEAILNLLLSIILVNKFGLIGIAIGTIIAMIYRLIFQIYYTKVIIKREQWKFYSKIIVFTCVSLIGIIICNKKIPLVEISIINCLIYSLIYSAIFLIIYLIASLIFFKKEINYFINYIKKEKKTK